MDIIALEYYRNKLLSLREKYKKTEVSIQKNNSLDVSEREEYDELSFYDNHPADLGTETFLREMSYAKLDKVKDTLKLINDALKKINENTFGICSICGRNIEKERLEAIPYSPYCIECENKHEKLDAENTNFRPSEEKISPYNFADLDLDSRNENVEYDGEDAYQDLERFNETNDPSLQTGDRTGTEDNMQSGIVESTDNISNIYYKKLMTSEEKEDTKNGDV